MAKADGTIAVAVRRLRVRQSRLTEQREQEIAGFCGDAADACCGEIENGERQMNSPEETTQGI